MMTVRDTRTGRAVSWGTDHQRMHEIAATRPHLVAVEDRAASRFYWYLGKLPMGAVHPYDLEAQRYAEIKP